MGEVSGVLDRILELPAIVQLALFAAHGAAVVGLGMAFLRVLHPRFGSLDALTPVAPAFVGSASIFALILAFHAADVWQQKHAAELSLVHTQSAVQRLAYMVGPEQVDSPEARVALRRYVTAVVNEEWLAHGNRSSSAEAQAAFLSLHGIVADLAGTVPAPVASQLAGMVEKLAEARAERLWIGSRRSNPHAWLTLMLLGLISHLALAAVHLGKPRAALLSLSLYGATTTLAFWSLALADAPYRRTDMLDPTSLLSLGAALAR